MPVFRSHNAVAGKGSRQGPIVLGRALACAAAVAFTAALSACRPDPVETDAPRIVALSPALAVMLRDMGLGDRVVGRHAWDMVLDPAVPVCGDQSGIDYEALLRVRPTHVVLEWGERELPPRLREMAARHGWHVRSFQMLTLGQVRGAAVGLEGMFGSEGVGRISKEGGGTGFQPVSPDGPFRTATVRERPGGVPPPQPPSVKAGEERPPPASPAPPPSGTGEGVVAAMDRAWSRRGDFEGAGRILLLTQTSPPAGPGPGSFHHELLERIGGTPALTEGGAFIRMDAEDLIRLDPDGIILLMPRPAARGGMDFLRDVSGEGRDPGSDRHRLEGGAGGLPHGPEARAMSAVDAVPAGLGVRAVREARVAVIDDPLCLLPGTPLIGLADALAAILEEWAGPGS
jgi:hypothetical protein